MIRLPKNWKFKAPSPELVSEIVGQLKISRAAASVLVNRGITSITEARAFLSPAPGELSNPFLLPDLETAVARIRRAIDGGEKILVYGDRDVDGVTSISIMIRTLRSLGADPLWYIPSEEGYGVHNEIIDRYAAEGVKLIVTVDCGISAVEQVERARSHGIDVVVTDHHEPPATGIPAAAAVVDPKRSGSKYPFSDLAGCSVSFKVSQALMMSFGRYFNEELAAVYLAMDGEPFGAAAVIAKNGLVRDTWTAPAGVPAAEAARSLLSFVGTRRLLVHGTLVLGEMERLTGKRPVNPFIDVVPLAAGKYPASAVDLPKLGEDLKIPQAASDAAGKARLVFEIFKRLEQLADLRMSFFQDDNMDVIALGTIADIMPLVKENRVLVRRGLTQLIQSKKVGVQSLLERCLTGKTRNGALSAKSVSWSITPVLNAAGRRGRADLSAELLLTESPSRASTLLDEIMRLNAERRELQAVNLEKFTPLLSEQCDLEKDRLFIVSGSGLEHGVTGIIASQIMRQHRRPVVLLIIQGDEAMGAARSIEGFDIVAALGKVGDLLIKFGGHAQAAGLTIKTENLPEFRRRLTGIAEKEISPEMLVPTIEIDAELQLQEVNLQLLHELAEMEPWGMGNPHPVFGLRNMRIREHGRVGANGDHLKLKVAKNGGTPLSAIGWGLGHMDEDIEEYAEFSPVDLAVQLEINTWQDKQSVQLLIQDIRISAL